MSYISVTVGLTLSGLHLSQEHGETRVPIHAAGFNGDGTRLLIGSNEKHIRC